MSDTIFNGVAPTASGGSGGASNQGIDFTAQHTGQVDGISWWQAPAGGPASVTGILYDTQTQAVIASQLAGALTPGAWNLIAFPAPPLITPGRLYTAAVFATNGTIGFTGGLVANHTFSGDLTAPLRTARFTNGAGAAFPGLNVGTDAFGVDLQFTETPTCPECPPCPPTEGFFINLTSPGFIHVATGVGQCVIEALDQTPAGAPCRRCLLVPTSAIVWDDCGCPNPGAASDCTGQVALAIRQVYGSGGPFPSPTIASMRKCQHRYEIMEAVVSVTRCLPTLTKAGAAPSCADELAASVVLENDRTAVRQAIACCLAEASRTRPYWVSEWSVGASTTYPEQGACGGSETVFYVGVQSCLCPD